MTEQRNGHLPTLVACFLHFDLSFMLWVLIGALGILIADDLHLSASQRGVLVALPILSGSLLRIPLGLLSDRWGARRVGGSMLAFLFVPLAIGWLGADSWATMMAVGLMLGTAGASFAVALPLASAWYPPTRQGLVMGIAAAGNSGTVITNLLAPRLSRRRLARRLRPGDDSAGARARGVPAHRQRSAAAPRGAGAADARGAA
jgi:MFS transporter, NNP family, nitrate/nitrite transporter